MSKLLPWVTDRSPLWGIDPHCRVAFGLRVSGNPNQSAHLAPNVGLEPTASTLTASLPYREGPLGMWRASWLTGGWSKCEFEITQAIRPV